LLQVSQDFKHEVDALHAFLETLTPEQWEQETQFMAWTPWDVVAHLHYFDVVSLASLEGEAAFAAERDAVMDAVRTGQTNKQVARDRFGDMDAKTLLATWQKTAHALAKALGESEPKRRLPWFGPDMGVPMFTTARYMETWAHGQEIYDLVGVERTYDDRIKNIATIGVKTFGWTFVNRGQEPPGPPPYVRLEAPSGEIWAFGEPSETECVRGRAVDFCHVVTQGRNVKDTELEVTGPVATAWMEIAQCFAGGAVDPPAPGTRGPKG
jgi:uncharacterized protein (TIGR03084 family)